MIADAIKHQHHVNKRTKERLANTAVVQARLLLENKALKEDGERTRGAVDQLSDKVMTHDMHLDSARHALELLEEEGARHRENVDRLKITLEAQAAEVRSRDEHIAVLLRKVAEQEAREAREKARRTDEARRASEALPADALCLVLAAFAERVLLASPISLAAWAIVPRRLGPHWALARATRVAAVAALFTYLRRLMGTRTPLLAYLEWLYRSWF